MRITRSTVHLFSHPSCGQESGPSSARCQPPCAPLGNLGPLQARRVVGSLQSLALSWGHFRHREATGKSWPLGCPTARSSGLQASGRIHGILPVGEPQRVTSSGERPAQVTQPAQKGLTVLEFTSLEDARSTLHMDVGGVCGGHWVLSRYP